MSVHVIDAPSALQRLKTFDAILDARSEGEYALDHLPGADNWPSLNDQERVQVGTLYKQVSPFEAQKIGAALVAQNISRHILAHVMDKPKSWKPLVYCWRGGKRSNSLALILGQIGFHVTLIEGGYKAFRSALVLDIPKRVQPLRFRVLCGPTGSGKTRLLHALSQAGAQVLDLEGLANHRSSVLGIIPGQAQPSQKAFETLVWTQLQQFDPEREVFVESESRKVGNLTVPESLMEAMRQSPCVRMEVSLQDRVHLLLEDYDYFVQQPELFCERLSRLSEIKGKAVVDEWQSQARQGQFSEVVEALLVTHYDPVYARSTRNNFARFDEAGVLVLDATDAQAMQGAARQLMQG